MFDVNDFLDRLLFRPLAELYRYTVPPGLRDRVAGIVTNMKEPVIFANNVLQGEMTKAGETVERFAMNTTVGIGGMWDVAGKLGRRAISRPAISARRLLHGVSAKARTSCCPSSAHQTFVTELASASMPSCRPGPMS